MIRIIFLLLVANCATVSSPPKLESNFRKDLEFEVDGRLYRGFAVLPSKPRYEIEISRSGGDYASLASCHRHLPISDPSRKIEIRYSPNVGIENIGSCLVQMSVLDERGRHRWGIIDLINGNTLPAQLQCNGEVYTSVGASFCQSRAGLQQRINFTNDVKAFSDSSCEVVKVSNKAYDIHLQKGLCVFLFVDKQNNKHRLTTFGYDDQINKG